MIKNNRPVLAAMLLLLFLSVSATVRSQNNVVITEVLYDTPLDEANGESGAHNGEFVELYNPTNRTIDLSDWRLYVGSYSHYYSFV